MSEGKLEVEFTARYEQAVAGVKKAGEALKDTAKKAEDAAGAVKGSGDTAVGAGKKFDWLQARVAALGVALGLLIHQALRRAGRAVTEFVRGSITDMSKFDAALNKSIAIMGDVDAATRKRMADTARAVSKDLNLSAEKLGEAYFFLASAGLDAEQSIAALPQVALFAKAGMFDLAKATDLLTDAQSALGLASQDSAQNLANMTRVSDVLVKANTLANASVQQFSESLTNKAGAALKVMNKDVEEGVAVLAALADQGLKGAASGEALSIVLRDLQTAALKQRENFAKMGVSVFDNTGKMRNMADIIGDLETAFAGLSDEQRRTTLMAMGFQDRSVSNILLLMGTSQRVREYEAALRQAGGTTQTVADQQMRSLEERLGKLNEKWNDFKRRSGEALLPIVEMAMRAGNALLNYLAGPLASTIEQMKELGRATEIVMVMQLRQQQLELQGQQRRLQQQLTNPRVTEVSRTGLGPNAVGSGPAQRVSVPMSDTSMPALRERQIRLNRELMEAERALTQAAAAGNRQAERDAQRQVDLLHQQVQETDALMARREQLNSVTAQLTDTQRAMGEAVDRAETRHRINAIDEEIAAIERMGVESVATTNRIAELQRQRGALEKSLAAPAAPPAATPPPTTGGGGLRPTDDAALRRMEAAREQLRRAAAEFARAQEFGFRALEDAPDKLQAVIGEVISLDTEISRLVDLIEASGQQAPRAVTEYLARIREIRDTKLDLAKRMKDDPALVTPEEAKKSAEALRDVAREYELLQRFGLGALSQAPEQFRSAVSEVGRLEREIEQLSKLIREAGDLAPQAARDHVAALQQQRDAAIQVAARLGDIRDILKSLPGSVPDLLGKLSVEQLQAAGPALREYVVQLKAAEMAAFRLREAELSGDKRAIKEAREAHKAAVAALRAELQKLIPVLRAAGLAEEHIAELFAAIAQQAEAAGVQIHQVSRTLTDLAKHLDDIEALARGVLAVGEALGMLDKRSSQALKGISDFAGGASTALASIASGNIAGIIAGTAQAVGGLINLGKSLFGEDDASKQRRAEIKANTQALERLRDGLGRMAEAVGGIEGRLFAGLADAALAAAGARGSRGFLGLGIGQAGRDRQAREAEFERQVQRLGLTMDEAKAIAQSLGITLNGTAESYQAFAAALEKYAFDHWLSLLQTRMELLRVEFDLFNIDDPVAKLRKFREVLLSFMNLDAQTKAQVEGFDLGTAEGRAAMEMWLKSMFERFAAGDESVLRELGGITPQEFLTFITQMGSLLEEASARAPGGENSVNQVTGISSMQANQLLAYASTQTARLGEHTTLLQDILATLRGGVVDLPFVPTHTGGGGRTLTIEQVVVNAATGATTAEEAKTIGDGLGRGIGRGLLEQVEAELRRREHDAGTPRGSIKSLTVKV